MENQELKTGFIAIVGPTNSGKSTLLNSLIGEKVSIVSPRSQTTYHGVRGILNLDDAQLVFVDTPGFQRHAEKVARLLNKVADRNAEHCEALIWVFDASNPGAFKQCMALKEKIAKLKGPVNNLCIRSSRSFNLSMGWPFFPRSFQSAQEAGTAWNA
jgi:GTP-binding protein Era